MARVAERGDLYCFAFVVLHLNPGSPPGSGDLQKMSARLTANERDGVRPVLNGPHRVSLKD
jgi:hypothetical protein